MLIFFQVFWNTLQLIRLIANEYISEETDTHFPFFDNSPSEYIVSCLILNQ